MVSLNEIDAQLERVGMKNRYFGRAEVKELCHIMTPGEQIRHAVNGQYEGGFAMMIATDRRLLLIDKKPWFLTMEDVRYDMIQEVDFYARLLDASISIVTFSKQLKFMSWRQARLRELLRYIQQRVMELRHQEDSWHSDGQRAYQIPLQPAIQSSDFTANYQAHVKRHSLAHVAGKVAVGFQRSKPIIRPLYPRPSLVSTYREGGGFQAKPATQTLGS